MQMGCHGLSVSDRPTHIPWVDEMERADAAVGPWSVHLLEIVPEMTDADVAKLQDEDEILGPVKSMWSQGAQVIFPSMTRAPCLWKVANCGLCGPPSSSKIRSWSDGMATRSPFGLAKNVGAITPPLLLAWHAKGQ